MQTRAIHGHGYSDERGAFIPPIYQSAVFEWLDRESGEIRRSDRGCEMKYSREENPTVRCLERVIASLEEGEDALCFSSGMAAISATLLYMVSRGDKVVLCKEAYGTTTKLFTSLSKKFGFELVLAGPDTGGIINAIDYDTKLVFVETMTNPSLRVLDVPEIAKACREYDAALVVDNTFTTPVLFQPLKHGALAVVHSATKYLAGHNDVLAGALVGPAELVQEVWDWRRMIGSQLSPFDAFLVLRGIKTLELRVKRQSRTAQAIAEYLEDHPKVTRVHYPGLPSDPYHSLARRMFKDNLYGGVVSFRIKGGREEAFKLMRALKIIKPSTSLGGTESIISYPALSVSKNMPLALREELGLTEDLLRLSVGLEDPEDLIEDLAQALATI